MRTLEEAERRITLLEAENLALRKRLILFENRLAVLENSNTPPSKRRFAPKKEESDEGKQRGRPPGAEGSTRETPEPTETVEATAEECPDCKARLGAPDFFESRVIEELPAIPLTRAIRFVVAHYNCRCGRHVVARHHELPLQGRFGPKLQAEIALLRIEDRLPFRKIQHALLRRHGVLITPATLMHVEERVADALQPQYAHLIEIIRTSWVVYCDETKFRVDGKDWWLWVFSDGATTLFVLQDNRRAEIVDEILGPKFKGIIASDGYAAYANRGIHQRCWAHLIRKLEFIKKEHPELSVFHEELQKLFHDIKQKIATGPPLPERLQIRRWAEEELRRLHDNATSHTLLSDFCTYLKNGMNDWLTFVEHPGVEPTNNISERALREHVVFRRIIGTLRGQRGAATHSILSSMLTTWKLQQKDAGQLLTQALTS